jgi:hypothetical protein
MLIQRHFWIGYSSLQLALGLSFAQQHLESVDKLVLLRKTNRYNSNFISNSRVYQYNPWLAIGLFSYLLFTRSTLWISGISPTSCSDIEKLALRFLHKIRRLRFYDDGIAGFVMQTYTWYHTLKILPYASGEVSWDHPIRSPIFEKSLHVNVQSLKLIDSGLNQDLIILSQPYHVFIEANGMSIDKLYSSFQESDAPDTAKFYFAHTDKGSVARQFLSSNAPQQPRTNYHKFYSHQFMMLESYLLNMLDISLSLTVYSGCTSTVLILLHYSSMTDQVDKLQVYYSPDFTRLNPDKTAQTHSFYNYLKDVYPHQCHCL